MALFVLRHIRLIMVSAFIVIMILWGKFFVPFIVDNYGLAGTALTVAACLSIAYYWDRR